MCISEALFGRSTSLNHNKASTPIALKDRIIAYLEPFVLLSVSLCFLPITALFHPILLISSPSSFRSRWFESFWRVIGPKMAVSPLQLEHIDELMSRAHGTVLELGPGGGDQMYHYRAEQIEKVYGVEPNIFLHEPLMAKAEEAGLGEKFVPVNAGAQPGSLLPALRELQLIPRDGSSLPEAGVFDTIITIKSMCSAPRSQLPATIAVAQALLKPGGEFLFFEHLGNNSDRVTQAWAWLIDLIWPAVMCGCRLDGKLDKVIMGMGGWEEKRMHTTGEYQGFEIFRYVKGECRKA